jgi:hypothetical protein
MPDEKEPLRRRGPRSLERIMLDLHRCEHGRLQVDPCVSCGGQSTGNKAIPPGTVIGHTLYGDEIVVPSWEDHNDPEKWIRWRR